MSDFDAYRRPNTYLHTGAIKGWPQDHKAEDTFDLLQRRQQLHAEDREYKAEFGTDGSARLYLITKTSVAKFDTFADAQLAAEALNNHNGF